MEKIKKKILVIGSSGMVGHVLVDYLSKNSDFEIFNLAKNFKINNDTITCDILDTQHFHQVINKISPNIIINSAGILVNQSRKNPLNAILVNSCFPHMLMEVADSINSKIIHLSTDCVFDGSSGNYDENSKKTPIDIYGKTKDLGEIVNNNHLTIRTSIIGPELKNDGTGLLLWLLKNKKNQVNGFKKSIWSGLTTLELSKAILHCVNYNLCGLLHIASSPISKFNLINIINDEFKLDIKLKKVDGIVSDKSLVSIRDDFNYEVQSHHQMIHDLRLYYESNKYVH